MSISAALSNALTGLNAQSRSAQVVSSNVANATTEGYARREIDLSARNGDGGGVRVDGVRRVIDETVIRDRRHADATLGAADATRAFYADVERLLGTPDQPGALTGQVAALESAVLSAASAPESEARLATVLSAGKALTASLHMASDGVQRLRGDAESSIAGGVARLNDGLTAIADLNEQILRAKGTGRDTAGLEDQRQRAVDGIADLVPLQTYRRDNGALAIYTTGGTRLVDAATARVAFTPAHAITPDSTHASGALSGLTIDGREIDIGANGPLAGGRLGALFAIRDDVAARVQEDLDAISADLIVRVSEPLADPAQAARTAGIFVDGGGAPVGDTTGLSARIAVNPVVDPAAGGALWRIRDGADAAGPGPVGDASHLRALSDAMTARRTPPGGSFGSGPQDAAGMVASVLSGVGVARQSAESGAVRAEANRTALHGIELAHGVDTDQEMQKLLLIEQAYAANARVIQTAGQMIDMLMEL